MFRSVSGAVVMVTIAPLISPYTILGGPGCLAAAAHISWKLDSDLIGCLLSPLSVVNCDAAPVFAEQWSFYIKWEAGQHWAALGSARYGQTDRHQPISSILSCPLGPVMNVDDTFINNNNMQRGGSQILYFFKSILTTPDRQTNRLTYRSASETIKYI